MKLLTINSREGSATNIEKPSEHLRIDSNSASGGRDARLDAMRGLMLILMTIAHMPNPIQQFTYESIGFVSDAEGFVFLSGYIAGIVYTRLAMRRGQRALWKSSALRAFRIYLYHITIFAVLLGLISTGLLKSDVFESWVPLFYQNPGLALTLGSMLIYQPTLLDILPMYCLFILISPLVIKQFLSRQYSLVLILSIGIWAAAQFHLRTAAVKTILRSVPIDLGDFDILAWQVLFVLGLFCGFRNYSSSAPYFRSRQLILLLAYVVTLIFFALRHEFFFPNSSGFVWKLADKVNLGPFRLLNFAALAFLIGQDVLWPRRRIWVRALAYLGRNSLQVFAFSIFFVYLIRGAFGPWETISEPLKVFTVLISVIALYVPAWVHERRARFKM